MEKERKHECSFVYFLCVRFKAQSLFMRFRSNVSLGNFLKIYYKLNFIYINIIYCNVINIRIWMQKLPIVVIICISVQSVNKSTKSSRYKKCFRENKKEKIEKEERIHAIGRDHTIRTVA